MKLKFLVVGKYIVSENMIGQGSSGKVFQALSRKGDTKFAVKIMKKNQKSQKQIQLLNDIQKIKKLSSPHIVKYHCVKEKEEKHYIFLEFCESDLKKQIEKKVKQNNFMSQEEIINFLTQICNGYKTLYNNNLIHRDIKPESILFHKGIYKIADFGFAKFVSSMDDKTQKTLLGTYYYAAPQIQDGKKYDSKCDIWSLGIILYQLLYFKNPFSNKAMKQMQENLKNKKIFIPHDIQRSQTLRLLMFQMLKFQQQERMDWTKLFTQPFLLGSQKIDEQHINVIKKVQKVLKYEKQLSNFIKRIFEGFCYFQSLLAQQIYRFGVLAFVYNIININKTINYYNFFQKAPYHPQISKQTWLQFKQTNNYLQWIQDFKDTKHRFLNFLSAFTPKINISLSNTNNQSLKKAVKKLLIITQNNSVQQYKFIIQWVIDQISNEFPQLFPAFFIDYIKIAKEPDSNYNKQTDFEKVYKHIDQEFKKI